MTATLVPGLRDLFAFVGLKQLDIAQRLGIDSSVVSLWVVGRRGVSYRHLAPLAAILGLTVEDLTASAPQAPEPVFLDPITYRGPRCSECDTPMPQAITRRRCQRCQNLERWRRGCFDNAPEKHWNYWTHAEEQRLLELVGRYRAADIRVILNREFHTHRTYMAVRVRVNRLGAYLRLDSWTMQRVCKLFGARHSAILRRWIETGLLKATRPVIGEGKGRRGEWRIEEADLEAFIRAYPWEFDAANMQPQSHRLARLARDLGRRDPWWYAKEAMVYLGIKRRAFNRWCLEGVIPARHRWITIPKGGGRGAYVVRASDLLEARRVIQERRSTAKVQNWLALQAGARRDRRAVAA